MKILINAVSARLGGGQTYIRNLLSLDRYEGVEAIYILKSEGLLITKHKQVFEILVKDAIVKSPFIRAFWENISIPNYISELDIDVYFCPGGSLNYVPGKIKGKEIKSVITFQNMLPLDYIQVLKYGISKMRLRNIILKYVFRKSMKAADLVIFLSEFAMVQAQLLCKGRIKKKVLIPHGIEVTDYKAHKEMPVCCPDTPYLLYVSTLDVYKSQKEVVIAFAKLKEEKLFQYKLVLAGESYLPYKKEVDKLINTLGISDDVIMTGHVNKKELEKLYGNAAINIFASQTENCPFILLEAMASGRPVLSSNMSPMPEIAGDTVLYFDPRDSDDLANSINKYLENPELMEENARKARMKVSDFSLKHAALKTWKAITSI